MNDDNKIYSWNKDYDCDCALVYHAASPKGYGKWDSGKILTRILSLVRNHGLLSRRRGLETPYTEPLNANSLNNKFERLWERVAYA